MSDIPSPVHARVRNESDPDAASGVRSAKAPLRIGYLVQQFPPEVGAGPARVTEMALRWQREGAEVTVITGMPNRPAGVIHPDYRGRLFMEEDWQGLRVLRSWLYASPKHGFARTLANNISFMTTGALHAASRLGDVDVLIASSPPFFPHIAGAVISRMRRIPLVLELRDLWPDYLVGMGVLREGLATRALFGLERSLLRGADTAVVVTDSFKRRVAEKGMPADRIHVMPNGVDTRMYRHSEEAPPIAELQRRGDEFLVGYLGNFGSGQQLTTVVEAAALLAGGEAPVRLVVAGDGPDRQKIEQRARELGTTNLTIHPPIPKDATRAFYNACDVCLVPLAPFPILQETVPSKIFEVMACERPVLASLAGEGERIVTQSGGGVVTRPGDAAAMAEAILRLRETAPGERAEMGRRGREFVEERYSRDGVAERYLDVLSDVAGRSGRIISHRGVGI